MAVSTLVHSTPGFQVTAPDDDMEIASDTGRMDNDFDIDIDLSGDPSRDADDDYMIEDVRSEAGQEQNIGNDDIMLDGDGYLVSEGFMRDDNAVRDEHLTDASEIGYEDQIPPVMPEGDLFQGSARMTVPQQERNDVDFEHAMTHTPNVFADATAEHQSHDRQHSTQEAPGPAPEVEERGHAEETAVASAEDPTVREIVSDHEKKVATDSTIEPLIETAVTRAEGLSEVTSAVDIAEDPETAQQDANEPSAVQHPLLETRDSVGAQGHESRDDEQVESSGEDDQAHQQTQENARSAGSTSRLHPCMVIYDSTEISLFPPSEHDESETFFLQDDSLVHSSISDLLKACRGVLGETIGEDDELEIKVAELGLTMNEDSAYASSTTFFDILDVYVRLYQNDGWPMPHSPLYITLTTKTRFSSRFKSLTQAANEGRGFSGLKYLRDPDVYYSESDEEDPATGDNEDIAAQLQAATRQPATNTNVLTSDDGGARGGGASPTNPDHGRLGGAEHAGVNVAKNTAAFSQAEVTSEGGSMQVNNEYHENSHVQKSFNRGGEGDANPLDDTSTNQGELESAHEDDLIDYNDGDDGDHGSSGSSTVQGDTSLLPEPSRDLGDTIANAQSLQGSAAETLDARAVTDTQSHEVPNEDAGLTNAELAEEHGQNNDYGEERDHPAALEDGDIEEASDGPDTSHEEGPQKAGDATSPSNSYSDAALQGFEREEDQAAQFAEDELVDPSQHNQTTEPAPGDIFESTYDEHEYGAFTHDGDWEGYDGQNDPETQEPDTEDAYLDEAAVIGEANEQPLEELEVETVLDDFDTVNYDEEDTIGDAGALMQGDEPPSGKRSWDEHNEDGESDGSEQAKRVRSN